MGPFSQIPFKGNRVGVSPLSTRPKKSSADRRTIHMLSYPEGASVKDYTPKDTCLGKPIALEYPTVDMLAERMFTIGTQCYLWKSDIAFAFKQVAWDPGDYGLFGFIWEGFYYFDKFLSMGNRVAPYIMQRVTNAICYVHKTLKLFLLNYVDDFVGAETRAVAARSFHLFGRLLSNLGIQEAVEKRIPATERLEFLGIVFDARKGTIEVSEERLFEIHQELNTALGWTMYYRQQLESIIGKLLFVAACVRPGRIFICRLLNTLRQTVNRNRSYKVTDEMRKDLNWWSAFLDQYNGVSVAWPRTVFQPDEVLSCDASLTHIGGYFTGQEYFTYRLSAIWAGKNIAHLEMWVVIMSLQLWAQKLKSCKIVINCDNMSVV